MTYWTDEEFTNAVKKNTTIISVLKVFGITNNDSYPNMKFWKDVNRLGLDISHFRRPTPKNKLDIDQFLVKNSKWKSGSTALKKRLLKENLIIEKCNICEQEPNWNGKPLTLQLDHINGDNKDNRLENLRLVCPNCHSQTETFSLGLRKPVENICTNCGCVHPTTSALCKSCFLSQPKKTKIKWPTTQELKKLLESKSFLQVGRELGVSDNAIRKRLTLFSSH
jgi:hypothetical protein